jgi:peroxiredoxin
MDEDRRLRCEDGMDRVRMAGTAGLAFRRTGARIRMRTGERRFNEPGQAKEMPMRGMSWFWCVRGMLAAAVLATAAQSQARAQYTPMDLLSSFQPRFKGVEYDLSDAAARKDDPAVKAAIEACKVEKVTKGQAAIGFALRDGQGKLLRKFVDTNGKLTQRERETKPSAHLDQWSYYQDGFEVYREVDLDEDGTLDEVRWLNHGGSRIAQVKGGKIVGWSRLSAEEASKVLVQAVATKDAGLLESVMARPEELLGLGLPEDAVKLAEESRAKRGAEFQKLLEGLKGWDAQTAWSRFDGMMPRSIPADAAEGMKEDVLIYENAVIFPTTPANGDPRGQSYLSAPEIVRIGEVWKFLVLPHAVDPRSTEPIIAQTSSLRAAVYGRTEAPAGTNLADDPKLQEDLKALADHDAKPPGAEATPKEVAQWHLTRIQILRRLIQKVPGAEDQLPFYKQVVHDLAEAYQTGLYPEGLQVFDRLIGQGGKLASFAAYRKILAQFELDSKEPGSNLMQLQIATLKKLKEYLEEYKEAEERPEVLYQLATALEFNGEEQEARTYYEQLAQEHGQTPAGKTAAGALRRLGLEGQVLKLSGPTASGKTVSVEDYRGKMLLVHFWATNLDPERHEAPELAKLYQKYRSKGFEILGVSLDADRAAAEAFLKQNQITWAQIFEEGGLESRLANEFGIITTPTMFLVDGQGKVVSRKVRKASEVEKYLDRPASSGSTGSLGLNRTEN